MRVALDKADVLAVIVARMLWEDAAVAARWPKLRGILDGYLEEAGALERR